MRRDLAIMQSIRSPPDSEIICRRMHTEAQFSDCRHVDGVKKSVRDQKVNRTLAMMAWLSELPPSSPS